MSDGHPFAAQRQQHVEQSRVHDITRARGGRVSRHDDEAEDRKLFGKMLKQHEREEEKDAGRAKGGAVKARADRVPRRATGGSVNKKSSGKGKGNHVNVIVVGGGKQQQPPMGVPSPPPSPVAAPPVAAARPMGGAPVTGAPGPVGAPGMVPPGAGMPMVRKRGGRVQYGPAYKEGMRAGTQVQHVDEKATEKANLHRGPVITKATGGAVEAPGHDRPRHSGGNFSEGKDVGLHDMSAGNNGIGRLEKMRKMRKEYP